MIDDTENTDSLTALLAGDDGEPTPANAGEAAEQILATEEGREVMERAISASEARQAEGKATEGRRGEVETALQDAVETEDFDQFGRLMAGKMAESQQQAAVNEAVAEGVSAEMESTVEALYGDTLRAMGKADPASVKALGDMPVSEAMQVLAKVKAAGTGASAKAIPPSSEDSQWNPEKARIIGEQRTAEYEQEKADERSIGDSARKQIADMEG